MTDITPADLGLPARFKSFRTSQIDPAINIASSERRFSLLSAPTGTGKSLIYMAVARLLEARTLVLTGTKGLQEQLLADFASIGMYDIRGQGNYRCLAVDEGGSLAEYGEPGDGCDEGPCHTGLGCPLKESGCFYYDALSEARESPIVVTNYAYWLTTGRYSDPDSLGSFDLLILDEAHSAPDWLANFCTIDIDRIEVRRLVGSSTPGVTESISTFAAWAKMTMKLVRERHTETLKQYHIDKGSDRRATRRKLKRLTELGRSLEELSKADQWKRSEQSIKGVKMPGLVTDWVIEEIPLKSTTKIRFSPVWAHAYAEDYLFRGVKKVILSSATLNRSSGKYLGVDPRAMSFHEVQSGFDPKRRPFIYIPTTRVDHRMSEGQLRMLVGRVDAIIDGRLHWKGIIHPRSYRRARDIYARSRHQRIMLIHDSRNAREVIERFKTAKPPCVLVSPSVEEGFDFPYDECSYQIIVKVPFIDGRSPIAKARMKSDRGYSNYVASIAIIQEAGRGVRSADDYCETFIIDDHWAWFRQKGNFPKWFAAAWRQMDKVPPPGGEKWKRA